MKGGAVSLRVLILAPAGRDAAVAEQLLQSVGVGALICDSIVGLLERIEQGAGLAIVVEEALANADLAPFKQWVDEQPSWSDFPFIILTPRSTAAAHPFTATLTDVLGNVSFVERPFHPTSLISLVRTALRGRVRQYEARSRLEELAVGQEQLRFAQEAGKIGTFELDSNTREVKVSPAFCRIWGFPVRPSVPLAELMSLLAPDDRTKIRTNDPQLRPDALDYIEYRVVRPDTGEVRWIARQGEPVIEAATGETRYFGVVYDITERRRAEEALRESEQRFRLIADSAPVPMWVTRLDRKRDFANRAYCAFIGLPYEDALVFDWRHIIHPDDIARIYEEQLEKEASLEPFTLEARYRNARGEWRWLRSESQPRWDASGHHSGFIGVAYDITANKIATEDMQRLAVSLEREVEHRSGMLRSQEAQLRTMFETSYQLQGILSLDGRLLDANARALDVMGATLQDVHGASFWETPFWAGAPAIAARLKAALHDVAAGEPFREEIVLDVADGQRAFDFSMRRLTGRSEEDSFIIFEAIELTERRVAEEQLRQAQKMESLGQLTGGIAHDFNNLLTGITGSLDLIKRRIEARRMDGIERFMDAAIVSAQRAASLTHRLLAFARRQSLDTKPTDANALVCGLEELLRRTLGESVRLRIELGPDLWPALSDANQLETALVNLAINSRDAMPNGGHLTIATANVTREIANDTPEDDAATTGDFVTIRVSDTGSGMPSSVIAKVFDPFFTTKPIGQGTGLGLSMVYGFLKQSGGFVEVQSEVGHGTHVTLFLPRASVDAKAAGTPTIANVPRGRGETVLVVEDDASVRLLMTEVLRELGYRYLQAEDARVAIPILESNARIDLLVTDVGLPHINGRQLAEIARQSRPDLKVLFVTGYAEGARVRGGFLAPGMEMITKPFALEELGTRIRALIGAPVPAAAAVRPPLP